MFHQYYVWRLDEEVMYWGVGDAYGSSMVPEDAFMKQYETVILEDNHRESGMFGIFTESDEFIGEVSYREMDVVSGTAVLGIMIGEKDFWGRGYGTDAVRTMCQFLFRRFRLRRIQLDTWSGNERAVKSYLKVGFRLEGTLREATMVNGIPTDQIVMGLLRTDFID